MHVLRLAPLNPWTTIFQLIIFIRRAGAVEQLRTHTKRLNSLYPAENQTDGKPVVELYEKGYGKDAAGNKRDLEYAL